MAHMIDTMAYAGETPWHGLGVKVNEDISVQEMVIQAGIDWQVQKRPLFMFNEDSKQVKVPGKQALVRATTGGDEVLSIVSDRWEPCQNTDAFKVFEEFVDRGELEMHTAGSLKNGQIVWGLAKMKDQFALFDDDVTEQYLLLVNPHVFGQGIHVRSTPIRVVCNNTLSLSLGQASNVQATQNHRSAFDAEAMKEAIGIAQSKLGAYHQMAQFMSTKRYTDDAFREFLMKVFPGYTEKTKNEMSRNAQRAYDIVETQPGAEFGKGTWWQAFNAVTYLADHELGRNSDARLTSAWFGINKDRKNKALELAVEYAEAA